MSLLFRVMSNDKLHASTFIQFLRVDCRDIQSNGFNITFQNSSVSSFYNVAENHTSFYKIIPDYENVTFTFVRKNPNKYVPFVDFVLKGIFYDVTVKITPFYDNYKPYQTPKLYNFLFSFFSVLFLFGIKIKRRYKLAVLQLLFMYALYFSSFSDVGIRHNKCFEIITNDFPKKSSLYDLGPMIETIPEILKFQEYNASACKLCNVDSYFHTDANSTPRDLIVTALIDKEKNMAAFVKTARTVRCKATILIFTNIKSLVGAYKECGVFVIYIGNATNFPRNMCRQGFRFKAITDFLNYVPDGTFNRIVYSDLYDTVFQGDPFLKSMNESFLILGDETGTVEKGRFDQIILHINEMKTLNLTYLNKQRALCSGSYMGTMYEMKLLFNIIANWMPFDLKDLWIPDQAFFLVCSYSKYFEKIGTKLIINRPGEIISSVVRDQDFITNIYPAQHIKFNNSQMLVLHHANRVWAFYNSMQLWCN